MFDFIKLKKAKKDFQNKYRLTNNEMSDIVFVKSPFTNSFVGGIDPNIHKPYLYKKIEELNPILKEKLNHSRDKFSELTNKYNKVEVYNKYCEACCTDLEDFLYLFQYNSSKVRISFAEGTPTNIMQQIWDKADIYLDAICLYYLLSLKEEYSEYSKNYIFSMLKHILEKEQNLFNEQYEGIYAIVTEKIASMSRIDKGYFNDWDNASTIK